jgi:RND family efflux transporter MFP subunit
MVVQLRQGSSIQPLGHCDNLPHGLGRRPSGVFEEMTNDIHWVARVALCLGLGCCLCACGKSSGVGQTAPPAPEVNVAKVLEKKIQEWDEYTGKMEAVETVEIRPRVSGYIDKVAFTEGKLVKQGELLFVIDPRPYQAERDRAAAEVKRLKTAVELAHIERARVQRLRMSGAVSQEELDERDSTVAQAEANLAGSQAALESAALNLSFTRVISPIDGRISRAIVTRGNLVTGGNNGGTVLTSVVSMDPIYLYFDGDEQAYLRYNELAREGERQSSRDVANPVMVGLANEDGFPHPGKMDFVDNRVNPQTGTIRARAVLKNPQGFFTPGMFARVQLLGRSDFSALLILDRAVNTDQNRKYVFVVGDGNKIEYRRIELGRVVSGLRVVRKGLKAGEVVVVDGAERVHPGIVVKPQTMAMAPVDMPADAQSVQ